MSASAGTAEQFEPGTVVRELLLDFGTAKLLDKQCIVFLQNGLHASRNELGELGLDSGRELAVERLFNGGAEQLLECWRATNVLNLLLGEADRSRGAARRAAALCGHDVERLKSETTKVVKGALPNGSVHGMPRKANKTKVLST